MCKPWKVNGAGGNNRGEGKYKPSETRQLMSLKDDLEDAEEARSNPYYPYIGP
jgi:hypothetical protein